MKFNNDEHQKTILIVEDDPFWSKRYSKLLEGIFACKTVNSFVDAIRYLQRSKPFALILDLKLGDSSIKEEWWGGWPLAEAAKKRGVKILWVAIEPCLYMETYICEFQATNDPNKPLSTLPKSKADQEIIRICKLVKEAASL